MELYFGRKVSELINAAWPQSFWHTFFRVKCAAFKRSFVSIRKWNESFSLCEPECLPIAAFMKLLLQPHSEITDSTITDFSWSWIITDVWSRLPIDWLGVFSLQEAVGWKLMSYLFSIFMASVHPVARRRPNRALMMRTLRTAGNHGRGHCWTGFILLLNLWDLLNSFEITSYLWSVIYGGK